MKKIEPDPAGVYKQYWLLKDIAKRIQCELGQTPFSKPQYEFLTKFLVFLHAEALAVAALHSHLRNSYTAAADEIRQERSLSVVFDGSWPVVMAMIADNIFTTPQMEMIVLAYKDLGEALARLRDSIGHKSVIDHADFAKRAERRKPDPKDPDPKEKILDRFDALRKIREHVLWNIGDEPFSKAQYDILFSFANALGAEEKDTTKLHPELDRIWNGSDGTRNDFGEGWQDETFGKLMRGRYDDPGLSMLLNSPLLSVRQQAECKAFEKTLTDEHDRISLKMYGRCARCDSILRRNEFITIYYSYNDKSKKDQTICRLCNWNEMVAKYQKDGELSSTIITEAIFYRHGRFKEKPKFPTPAGLLEEVCETMDLLDKEAERFEREVWAKWLWRFCTDQKERVRHSFNDKHLKVMVFSGLGRVLITLADQFPMGHKESIYNGATITFITTEDAKGPAKVGWQGLCGSRTEALKLIGDAIVNMYPDHLKFDKEVSFMGM